MQYIFPARIGTVGTPGVPVARELVSKPKEASCVAIVISALAHEELEKRTGTEEYRIHRIDLNLGTAKLQTKIALALPLLRRLQQIGQAVKQMTGRVRPQPFVRPVKPSRAASHVLDAFLMLGYWHCEQGATIRMLTPCRACQSHCRASGAVSDQTGALV